MAARSKQERLQEQVIACLLTERTHALAAQQAGISESTLQRWLSDPAFIKAYRAARRAVVDVTVGRLQQLATKAAETLETSLDCDHQPTRVRAALAILEQCFRGLQLADLEERVAELEREIEESENARKGVEPPGG